MDLVVRGEASFDPDTGVARWTITGLDPDTGEVPVDALVGFLPPEDGTGSGQGFASYSAVPLPGSTTGTTIDAAASIVFDLNDPIDTNVWTNTVDAGAPDGTVDDLPGSTPGPVPVSWSATDDGSGPATYDVWVSVDGGPLEIWQNDTTDTAGDYPGEPGHSYGFAVAATDAVGHAEPAPTDAATTTTVEFPAPEPVDDDAQTDEDTAVTVDVLANDPEGLSIVSVGDAVHGDVEIDGNRVTYTPDDDFHGDDTFTYTVVDEHDQEATATVRMTVTPVNDPPVARDDEATTAEATAVTVAVLDNDTDVDGDPLVVASFTQGGHGLVAAAPGGGLTYTPEGGFAGTDTFEYTAADPSGAESTATVRIEVEGGDGCTVTGTERPDILTGTSGPDVICGLGGGDLLIGFGGDDILIGGDGPDVLFGGSGDDTLLGGDGHDVLFGGSGHDRLEGRARCRLPLRRLRTGRSARRSRFRLPVRRVGTRHV
ncbi:MAG: tandem-95 repeat protein [Acidimicrobiia bacterium]|nr:tandem-95 repeat protein [Acidimicrobiia bacterium]